MEQLGVVAGNLALSFSFNFFSIFVHISASNKPITVNWASLERSAPPAEVEYTAVSRKVVQQNRTRQCRKALWVMGVRGA